jgi:replicative DNA helicase
METNGNGKYRNGNGNGHISLIEPLAPPPYQASSRNGKKQNARKLINTPLPPCSIEAEESLLGSILIEPDMIIEVTFLSASDFYIIKNGWVFAVLQALFDRRAPMDLTTIQDELEQRGQLAEMGGPAYLTDLINATPTALHAEYYARIVYRDSVRRQIIEAAGKIVQTTYSPPEDMTDPEELLGAAQSILLDVEADRAAARGPQSARSLVDRMFDRLESLKAGNQRFTGLPTGFPDIDQHLSGLRRGMFYVLAGRPGMGKSSLAFGIAHHLAKKEHKSTLIFSLEMPGYSVMDRLVSAESGIDLSRLSQGGITDEEWPAFIHATSAVQELPIYIDDSPALRLAVIRSRALRHKAKYGLDFIIVDHIGKARSDHRMERYDEVSEVSNGLMSLAKELDVPVLALCQLSRTVESRHDKRPMLSDLRDSGRIEEDAYAVMFLYRDEVYNANTEFPNIAEIIIAKNRDGATGATSVYFKKRLASFAPLIIETRSLEYGIH